MLGPSGCGKTTLLRMIAGFNSIESGTIYFNDKAINGIPPYKRHIGMVFQNYAIFPHMTVRRNVEFGLKQAGIDRSEIKQRVDEIMEIVKITEHAEKSPSQLSGGQQQRVALARAIVIHPTVLLMDEPLSNLDAKLRVEMRSAIREIQKEIGITTVYVTHDQEEALAVSDRIAVMNFGEIQQVGTPTDLYTRPQNNFVAGFVGTSNFIPARLRRNLGGISLGDALQAGEDQHWMDYPINRINENLDDDSMLVLSVRPEEFLFSKDCKGMKGEIRSRVFLGRYINYELDTDYGIMQLSTELGKPGSSHREGDTVYVIPDTNRLNLFDSEGQSVLVRER